jgi:hypothetical protein
MCGVFTDPHEIARALTIAAAPKIVVNQAGKSVEESNIELAKQMSIVYKTILKELSDGDELDDDFGHTHEHTHADGLVHSHGHSHVHGHDGEHVHSHVH